MQGLIVIAVIVAVLVLVGGVIKVASNPGSDIERRDRERVRARERVDER
ncbi:hypothetical protein [Nocardia rhizosphaerae]|uniref:Uncharacterized protein n=1 Tax=Nocardia rhizosphaerae TaxID=1691571 RepID=A0ABV8L8L4_9NOCA